MAHGRSKRGGKTRQQSEVWLPQSTDMTYIFRGSDTIVKEWRLNPVIVVGLHVIRLKGH